MGPTGTGKSALAIRVAQTMPTVIINADAMQMVRDLRVLSARPSAEEEAAAEHALYGVLDAAEPTSVARWVGLVVPVIEAAWAQGKWPLLVGGTGMYVKALRDGLVQLPALDPEIRAAVRSMDASALHAALQQEDPAMAAQLKPGDTQRLARALEVVRSTGRSLQDWQAERTAPALPNAAFLLQHLTLPRAALYARLNSRFSAMLQQGALEEVRALYARGLPADTPILRAHGAPELAEHLAGRMELAEAVAKAQQNTRNYAKRQMTWLRHQAPESQAITADNTQELQGFLHQIVTHARATAG